MAAAVGWVLRFVLGVLLVGLGAYIALRPLWTHNASLTGQRWLDATFAVVFLLRGLVNIRTARARRLRARMDATTTPE
jgi:hypothetical protein